MNTEIIERHAMLKVWRRVVPLMAVVSFLCALDKASIGFAALQMNAALGFSNTVFGMGAGSFALGYLLFAIPSTLLLHRVGARRWISLIMVLWSLCSAATAFVTRPEELILVRTLLGVAEAGFAPGMILYFSYWFPSEYRGRVLGSFFMIQPLVFIIGGPLSGAILSSDALNGLAGLGGWQWMFIIENIPALLLAPLVFVALTDRLEDARWLAPAEQEWLAGKLAAEQKRIEGSQGGHAVWQTFANGRVWMLAAVYLGIGTCGVGLKIFLPLIIRTMGFSIWHTGLIIAAPAIAGALAIPLWGVWADRTRNRETVVAAACWLMAAGQLLAAALLPSPWALVAISLTLIGFYGCLAAFWTLPSSFLTGAGAATGIALINMSGNLAQFTGPALIGFVSDLSASYNAALACLAAIAAGAAAALAALAMRERNLNKQELTAPV